MAAEQTCAESTHRTRWILYGLYHHAVDTPDIKCEGYVSKPEAWNIMCQHCGLVWAKRINVDLSNDNWQVKRWPCQSCGNGSLWDAWNKPWNRSLGPDLLHREMQIIKNWWDEGIRTYNQFFQYKHFRRKV